MSATRFSVAIDPVGGHAHVRVWANGANVGTLVMAAMEALDLRKALGADDVPAHVPGCTRVPGHAGCCDTRTDRQIAAAVLAADRRGDAPCPKCGGLACEKRGES